MENAVKIASAAKALEIPVLLTEQYPKGLGHTVPQLQEALPEGSEVVEKLISTLCWKMVCLIKLNLITKSRL